MPVTVDDKSRFTGDMKQVTRIAKSLTTFSSKLLMSVSKQASEKCRPLCSRKKFILETNINLYLTTLITNHKHISFYLT